MRCYDERGADVSVRDDLHSCTGGMKAFLYCSGGATREERGVKIIWQGESEPTNIGNRWEEMKK